MDNLKWVHNIGCFGGKGGLARSGFHNSDMSTIFTLCHSSQCHHSSMGGQAANQTLPELQLLAKGGVLRNMRGSSRMQLFQDKIDSRDICQGCADLSPDNPQAPSCHDHQDPSQTICWDTSRNIALGYRQRDVVNSGGLWLHIAPLFARPANQPKCWGARQKELLSLRMARKGPKA
eukprot:5112743-Amphidinium_carterae.1